MAFQEFYCDASTGSNLNSGSDTGAPVTTTGGTYTRSGGSGGGFSDLFAAAAGTPFSGRTVGDYVSIYNDGASAPTTFVAIITAINGGGASIDINSARSSNPANRPTTGGSRTATVGGPWLGPNAASSFPFNFLFNTALDASNNSPRINFKNNATYNMTATITTTVSAQGAVWYQGYTSTPGDGGKAIIDGGTSGVSYTLLNVSTGGGYIFIDFQFSHNGATGAASGVAVNAGTVFIRCIFNAMRGFGALANSTFARFVECEAYGNNTSNTANIGGFGTSGNSTIFLRCYAHDNTGNQTSGFVVGQGGVNSKCSIINCIAESNGKCGIDATAVGGAWEEGIISGSDFYNNISDGIKLAVAGGMVIENCNFAKNGGWGINGSAAILSVNNCGFGTGSDVNTSGTVNACGILLNSITYSSPTNPWNAPTTGDFRIISQKALNAGYTTFVETGNSKTGTTGYPDVGSAQHRTKAPSMYITGSKV